MELFFIVCLGKKEFFKTPPIFKQKTKPLADSVIEFIACYHTKVHGYFDSRGVFVDVSISMPDRIFSIFNTIICIFLIRAIKDIKLIIKFSFKSPVLLLPRTERSGLLKLFADLIRSQGTCLGISSGFRCFRSFRISFRLGSGSFGGTGGFYSVICFVMEIRKELPLLYFACTIAVLNNDIVISFPVFACIGLLNCGTQLAVSNKAIQPYRHEPYLRVSVMRTIMMARVV